MPCISTARRMASGNLVVRFWASCTHRLKDKDTRLRISECGFDSYWVCWNKTGRGDVMPIRIQKKKPKKKPRDY